MNLGTFFAVGSVCSPSCTTKADLMEFIPHKNFKGVFLKHLVKGESTENQLSCHLVRIEPFCTLDLHVHENNLEIHEVIAGDGMCKILDNQVEYKIGTIGIIPANVKHSVTAGKDGLYILAKFSPALL
ncbi:cupin domain-containing protein [Desulfovibrio litoralis]|uniref:Cupin domain-containing protein n=1 Tax=Desulfovibrio litoralis DSM 11393 TaxID=1121455 RepID=A0A1M7TNI9_9BACT|nr:hypothetical protein [Desulfovibrio litoralis]SHN72193.1 hypothetical protein SAMN02745728_02296 [Desulfovibrio litoralis DSM 11393]